MSVFVDTNVLVYARDRSHPAKQEAAAAWMDALWRSGRGRLSAQVLNEYYVTVTRKLRPGLPAAQARTDVADLAAWGAVPVTPELTARAFDLEDRFGLSFWDAMVVAGALASGATHLLTEDLQHGQDLAGITVVDPFRTRPDAIVR